MAHLKREAPQVHRAQELAFRQRLSLDCIRDAIEVKANFVFNGRGLIKLKGQRRGDSGGNHIDMETGESFWVSGAKKNGQDRHWAGSGQVLIEHSLKGDLNGFFRAQIKNPRAWATTGIQTVSMLG